MAMISMAFFEQQPGAWSFAAGCGGLGITFAECVDRGLNESANARIDKFSNASDSDFANAVLLDGSSTMSTGQGFG